MLPFFKKQKKRKSADITAINNNIKNSSDSENKLMQYILETRESCHLVACQKQLSAPNTIAHEAFTPVF